MPQWSGTKDLCIPVLDHPVNEKKNICFHQNGSRLYDHSCKLHITSSASRTCHSYGGMCVVMCDGHYFLTSPVFRPPILPNSLQIFHIYLTTKALFYHFISDIRGGQIIIARSVQWVLCVYFPENLRFWCWVILYFGKYGTFCLRMWREFKKSQV